MSFRAARPWFQCFALEQAVVGLAVNQQAPQPIVAVVAGVVRGL